MNRLFQAMRKMLMLDETSVRKRIKDGTKTEKIAASIVLHALNSYNKAESANNDEWKTINGTHVEVKGGSITKGPEKLKSAGQAREPGKASSPSKKTANKKPPVRMSKAERAKITSEINTLYHAKFKGLSTAVISTHPPGNKPAYDYVFRIHDFDNYEFLSKRRNKK